MLPGGRILVSLTIASAASSATIAARAQNTEGFFYSEDAALMAGAVTARPADSASLWYNPAGLAGIAGGRITASGSVFGLRVRSFDHALDTELGRETYSLDLHSTDVVAVPNALTGVFHLAGPVTLGVGLFVTTRDVRKAADTVVDAPISEIAGATLSERADLQTDITKYHLGPGVGIALTERVRIGIAAFASYATSALSAQFAFAVAGPGGGGHSLQLLTIETTTIGLTGALGVQADLTPHLSVGVTVRPPEVVLDGAFDGGTVSASAVSGPDGSSQVDLANVPELGAEGTLAAPARLTAGLLWRGSRLDAEVDVDVRSALRNDVLDLDLDPQLDVRAGLRWRATDIWTLGAGAFSDRASASGRNETFSNERVDYYGGALGVTLRSPFTISTKPDDPDGLVLTTTLAVRYAVGVGEIRGLVLGDRSATPLRDVTYHDLMPFFGSSIAY